jgi:hypothetical protein
MGGLARADVWNLQNQFSTTLNPNGAWSYGWEPANFGPSGYQPNGPFALYNSSVVPTPSYGTQIYSSSVGDVLPAVLLMANGGPNGCCETGGIALHPGAGGQFSVVQWTAPIAGTADVTGYFGAGDQGAMSYFVLVNGNVVDKWLNDSGRESFGFSQVVAPGSTIDFAVGYNTAGGGYSYGTTPLNAIISVPEPSILALLIPALGFVGVIRKRFMV